MRKRWMWVIAVVSVILTACGEQSYEPREVNPETDICKVCNMSIVHVEYAGQIVLKNGDHEIFDDLGCLVEFLEGLDESAVGAMYIKDMTTAKWIDAETATYLYSKDYWTPMNYGVLAFSSKEDAEQWQVEQGSGELLSFNDLKTFEWGIHE